MRRVTKQLPLIEGRVKYEVRIEGDACQAGTAQAVQAQYEILKTIANTPGLIDCGTVPFETMRVFHDGTRWVAVLEASTI